MTNALTRSPERRKSPRQAPRLRVSWRVLGNRHMRFGEAALKDIGTCGLALHVDQLCPVGTVVIVQFEGVAEEFAEPMLLQAAWSNEPPRKNDEPATYLLGCSFTTPLGADHLTGLLEAARKAAAAPAVTRTAPARTPAQWDPFLVGSAGDKRKVVRRQGMTVPVVVCRAGGSTPVEASVVDRSLKGLGILVRVPIPRGTLLKVRPGSAHDKTLTVEVLVRNCRQKGKQWLIGCQFPHTPPANVLMLLG
jgi:hypothetical protein